MKSVSDAHEVLGALEGLRGDEIQGTISHSLAAPALGVLVTHAWAFLVGRESSDSDNSEALWLAARLHVLWLRLGLKAGRIEGARLAALVLATKLQQAEAALQLLDEASEDAAPEGLLSLTYTGACILLDEEKYSDAEQRFRVAVELGDAA